MHAAEWLDPLLANVATSETEPAPPGLQDLADRLRTPAAEIRPPTCPSPEFQLVLQLDHGPVGREFAEHADVADTSGQPLGVRVVATCDEHPFSDHEGSAGGPVLHHSGKAT
jgi:hypothetical protein